MCWRIKIFAFATVLLLSSGFIGRIQASSEPQDPLEDTVSVQEFINPPLSARAGGYWPWLNGNVDLKQITRELEEIKQNGMRCLEIWDIGSLADPEGMIPPGPAFLGEESLEAISHAIDEADRLGLELGMIASSSWNAGGAWIGNEHASKQFDSSEVVVTGPSRFSQVLPLPPDAKSYYKDIAVLAFPKTEGNIIKDVAGTINLSGNMNDQGLLTWEVPAGEWVIARYIYRTTGQPLMCPSPNSKGLMIDHLSGRAAEKHFGYMIDQLLKKRGKLDSLKYFELDSYEVWHRTDWTDDFVAEFKKRRRYDLTPYLPLLKGWKTADPDITERFLYDWKKTVSDLIIDNHFRKATEIAHKAGLLINAEAGHGGSARVDVLKALGAVDLPRGEFWNGMQFWVTKEAASAAHIYGGKIVDAESLTGWRHWKDGPMAYKRLIDMALCAGLNRVTFHTFAHNPHEAGQPGYAYHAGEHFNVNTTWWPKAKPFLDYIARCCFLLQKGLFVADVCLYYGDQAPNFVPSRRIDPSVRPRYDNSKCLHCGRPIPVRNDLLGSGYDCDYVNTDVILTRMSVKDGRLVLPDGMSYRIMVLPEKDDMPVEVIQKLEGLVRAGATIVGPKPVRTRSLTDYPRCDKTVKKIADKLWGPCDGKTVKIHNYGKGKVIWGIPVLEVLKQHGLTPDLTVTKIDNDDVAIDYIHRRTAHEDIYLVTNNSLEWKTTECIFRISGKKPELWQPDTGRVSDCLVYDFVEGGTKVPLKLAPVSSVFVVFRKNTDDNHIIAIEQELQSSRMDSTKNLPVASLPDIQPLNFDGSKFDVRVWRPGTYRLRKAGGKTTSIQVSNIPEPLEIAGAWKVVFTDAEKKPKPIIFDRLMSWTKSSDFDVKYYSGTAVYHKEFVVSEQYIKDDLSLWLNLGQVKEVAEVILNGQNLGIFWKTPYCLDISQAVKPGKNVLEIAVINLWNNRLVGDASVPEEKRVTKTNVNNKFNNRTALLDSGLIGPVKIHVSRHIRVFKW